MYVMDAQHGSTDRRRTRRKSCTPWVGHRIHNGTTCWRTAQIMKLRLDGQPKTTCRARQNCNICSIRLSIRWAPIRNGTKRLIRLSIPYTNKSILRVFQRLFTQNGESPHNENRIRLSPLKSRYMRFVQYEKGLPGVVALLTGTIYRICISVGIMSNAPLAVTSPLDTRIGPSSENKELQPSVGKEVIRPINFPPLWKVSCWISGLRQSAFGSTNWGLMWKLLLWGCWSSFRECIDQDRNYQPMHTQNYPSWQESRLVAFEATSVNHLKLARISTSASIAVLKGNMNSFHGNNSNENFLCFTPGQASSPMHTQEAALVRR